jgi:virginiamycin A acetyltransferase
MLKHICYIKNTVKNPRIVIGDYTYYEDPECPEDFERHVTYLDPLIGDRLVIGRFCGISRGIEFIMNGFNRRISSVTAYPFHLMGEGREEKALEPPDPGLIKDTVIDNDVLIQRGVTVLPGVHIGDGAVILANSVVSTDIPPYWIAGGNPVRIIKKRFDDDVIKHLLDIQWWNWPAEKIFENLDVLGGA